MKKFVNTPQVRILLFALLFFSCEKEQVSQFVKIETIQLNEVNNESDFSWAMKTFPADRNDLYFLVRHKNEIRRYDLNTLTLSASKAFDKKQDGGISSIGGFSYCNDLLYVTSTLMTKLFSVDKYFNIDENSIVDYSSKQVDRTKETFYSSFNSFNHQDVIKLNNHLYIPQEIPFIDSDGESVDNNSKLNYSLLLSYDYQTDSIHHLPVYLPSNFFDSKGLFSSPMVSHYDNKIIISFAYSEDIILFDGHTTEYLKHNRSKYIEDFISPDNYTDPISYHQLAPEYGPIMYDELREQLFRLVYYPNEPLRVANMLDDINYVQNTAIMHFNTDYNIASERILDNKQAYTKNQSFIGPKGIYFLRNNPYSDTYEEDKLSFDIWDFNPVL